MNKLLLITLLFFSAIPALGSYSEEFTSKVEFSSSVTITTTAQTLVKASMKRIGLVLYNNSANSIYIFYGDNVSSSTRMTYIIASFSSWTMPKPIYTGLISGIRNSGTGNVLVTDLMSEN